MLLQGVGNVQRVGSRDLRSTNGIDRCRHLVDINSRTGDRRRRGRVDKNPCAHFGWLEVRRCCRVLVGPLVWLMSSWGSDLDGRQDLTVS